MTLYIVNIRGQFKLQLILWHVTVPQ